MLHYRGDNPIFLKNKNVINHWVAAFCDPEVKYTNIIHLIPTIRLALQAVLASLCHMKVIMPDTCTGNPRSADFSLLGIRYMNSAP